jgi:hypothetical protein
MAVRDDFTAGEVLAAADLNDTFASKANLASPTFTGTVTIPNVTLGAWTSYTPVLGGSGWAIGNGTVVGAYARVGRIVHFRALITFGSTSTFGASQAVVSAPVALRSGVTGNFLFNCVFLDHSADILYSGQPFAAGGSDLAIRYLVVGPGNEGLFGLTAASLPFTWATSDYIRVVGTYEAAS